MRPVILTIGDELRPDDARVRSFGRAAYPEFHGLLARCVDNKFPRRGIVSSRCENAPDIRAMRKLSQSKAAQINSLFNPATRFVVLLGAQCLNSLVSKLKIDHQFYGYILADENDR